MVRVANNPTSDVTPAPVAAEPLSGKLTVDALERYLWSAADILRDDEAEKLIAKGESHEWSLNISRYVETAEPEKQIDLAAAVAQLREAERARNAAEQIMNQFLAELRLG